MVGVDDLIDFNMKEYIILNKTFSIYYNIKEDIFFWEYILFKQLIKFCF